MNDFIIVSRNNYSQAFRIVNNTLDPLLFAGELCIKNIEFWDKFKTKIEYSDNDKLALIIINDNIGIAIDPAISIADQFMNSVSEINLLISDLSFWNAKVNCHPNIGNITDYSRNQKPLVQNSTEEKNSAPVVTESSLQAFYRRQTRDYKTGDV